MRTLKKDDIIVVTGADGMIGANTLKELSDAGYRNVFAVDKAGSEDKTRYVRDLPHAAYEEQWTFLEKIKNNERSGIAAIIHLGACSDTTETDRDFLRRNNIEYSKALFDYCTRRQCQFIYASSAATYGDGSCGYDDAATRLEPLNPYGESKHLFDLFVRSVKEKPPQWVGLKFFNVYGPYESHKGRMASLVPRGYQQAVKTGAINLFVSEHADYENGSQERDFVSVEDCVKVMLFFLTHPDTNGIFNVGTGKARTWNDLARAIFSALGKEPRIAYMPLPDNLKGKYQYHTEADISALRNAGYTDDFLTLEEGIFRYVKWLQEHE